MKIEREKTSSTPSIFADSDSGYMRFEGESFHEDVISFYGEVFDWLKEFLKTDFEQFTFDCELKYLNSSSVKMLLNMLLLMDEAAEDGKKITVNWIHKPSNEIVKECGEDISDGLEFLEFNFVEN